MFQDIKVKRYKLWKTLEGKYNARDDFKRIDNYKKTVSKYIYTDIEMTDGSKGVEDAFQSRLQILISSVLLRSLMLKDGIILALNNNNFPSYYANLKSFYEVPALLGYLLNLIHYEGDYDKIIQEMNKLFLANRKAGIFTVGKPKDIVNIDTLFKVLDKVLKELDASKEGLSEAEKKEISIRENTMSSLYKDINNFAHINWQAHLSVGILNREHIWEAKKDASQYKRELYNFYMDGFIIALTIIPLLCSLLMKEEKVDNYNLLNNKLYFDRKSGVLETLSNFLPIKGSKIVA